MPDGQAINLQAAVRGPERRRMEKSRVGGEEVPLDVLKHPAAGGPGKTISQSAENFKVFSQGDSADALRHILAGKPGLCVFSNEGKETAIAVPGGGDFFGAGRLTAQLLRPSSAATMSECSLLRIVKATAVGILRTQKAFSDVLLTCMLMRTMRIEEDPIDHLFNSSDKRLAPALIMLANFRKDSKPETVIPKISQETLALIIGTTSPRLSFFMNKSRKPGLIKYNSTPEINSSMLNVILHDQQASRFGTNIA
jgi:CRP/FNR family cyclic AMP-dependent transcriptional regulator